MYIIGRRWKKGLGASCHCYSSFRPFDLSTGRLPEHITPRLEEEACLGFYLVEEYRKKRRKISRIRQVVVIVAFIPIGNIIPVISAFSVVFVVREP